MSGQRKPTKTERQRAINQLFEQRPAQIVAWQRELLSGGAAMQLVFSAPLVPGHPALIQVAQRGPVASHEAALPLQSFAHVVGADEEDEEEVAALFDGEGLTEALEALREWMLEKLAS